MLKEYIARGTYIYPPRHSLRLISDIFAYCRKEIPRWNTISISGYHMAEAGATPAQEVAFTLADAKAYVRAAIDAGLAVDDFAPRLSFFFVARTTLLEEVAKFRAARRIWAQVMRDEFGAQDPKSLMLRFHTQTAGVQLTAQQPEVNLVRVTVQALAAVLGGTQSLHTNSYDEAIALPTEKAARLALRTQQVIAFESDLTATVDPFAGSYAVESMTDELETAIRGLMDNVEELGGAVAAIEAGYQKREIEQSAYDVATLGGGRLPHGRRREPVPAPGRRGLRAAPGRPDDRGPAGRAAGRPARRPRLRGGRAAPRRPPRRGRGRRQRALPDARRAAGPGDRGRGLQRPARGVGDLPARRRLLSTAPRHAADPCRAGKVCAVTARRDDPDGRLEGLDLDRRVAAYADDLVALRRDLHAHPELSWAEVRTTRVVRERLLAAGLSPVGLPGGTGLTCDIGSGDGAVALRADLDALPIVDGKSVDYASTVPGVCHACGHDVHTAAVLGAGLVLRDLHADGLLPGPGASGVPAGRGVRAQRGAGRPRRRRGRGRVADLRAALRPAGRRWARWGCGPARSPAPPTTCWSGSPAPAATPRART